MKRFEAQETVKIDGRKIAILLPNPCNPDYRVIKHAEFFARNGYDVRVYCRWADGLPFKQVINNVTYIRRPITGKSFLLAFVKSLFIGNNYRVSKVRSANLTKL